MDREKKNLSFFEQETSRVQRIDGKFFQGSPTRSFSLVDAGTYIPRHDYRDGICAP